VVLRDGNRAVGTPQQHGTIGVSNSACGPEGLWVDVVHFALQFHHQTTTVPKTRALISPSTKSDRSGPVVIIIHFRDAMSVTIAEDDLYDREDQLRLHGIVTSTCACLCSERSTNERREIGRLTPKVGKIFSVAIDVW
jgi:hypothetical protein